MWVIPSRNKKNRLREETLGISERLFKWGEHKDPLCLLPLFMTLLEVAMLWKASSDKHPPPHRLMDSPVAPSFPRCAHHQASAVPWCRRAAQVDSVKLRSGGLRVCFSRQQPRSPRRPLSSRGGGGGETHNWAADALNPSWAPTSALERFRRPWRPLTGPEIPKSISSNARQYPHSSPSDNSPTIEFGHSVLKPRALSSGSCPTRLKALGISL